MLVDRGLESGSWFCRVCAACEERLVWFEVPLSRNAPDPDENDARLARPFHGWFERTVALEHEHDWVVTGCHARGLGTIACTYPWGERTFYVTLPRVPVETIAREMALRLARATPAERTRLLADLHDEDEGEDPFWRIQNGEEPTPEEFAAAHAAWSERHPLWR